MKKRLALTINEILFLTAISIYYLAVVMGETIIVEPGSMAASLCTYTRLLSYALMAAAIVQLSIKEKHITAGCIIGIGLGACAIFSKSNSCVYSFLILIAALSADSRKIIRQTMTVQLLILIAMVGLSLGGIIDNVLFASEARLRYGLGFAWTTTSAILFLFISLEYMYLREKRITIPELALIQAAHVFFFIKTDSKMCFAVATVAVILDLIIKYHGRAVALLGSWYTRIMAALPAAAFIISIIISACYNENSPFWYGLNSFLNGRLRLGKAALLNYGITPFGQDITWVGSSVFGTYEHPYNYVDCSYVQLLLNYGILFILFVLALYTVILLYARKNNKPHIAMVVSLVLLFSITEPRLWNLGFNPLPFLIVDVVKAKK